MQTTAQRRALGSFYTPEWIAGWMVSRALSACDAGTNSTPLRVLDPACGDGAFLLAVLEWIAVQRGISSGDASGRLAIVCQHVFGVDADPQAIAILHRRIAEWIGAGPSNDAGVSEVLAANFRYGDSLLGSDWSGECCHQVSISRAQASESVPSSAEPIDWCGAFPMVATEGGFDLVIGNPPYRRELNAKDDFDRIAASQLGQRWRTARMDLWHYFFHRGLDLLKPSGRLAFIVNSYWTGSTAAGTMRERMSAETSMEEIVFLGAARLFRDVSGRHMIFRLRKTRDSNNECRIVNLENLSYDQIKVTLAPRRQQSNSPSSAAVTLRQHDLWKAGRLQTDVPARGDEWSSSGLTLGDVFEVRQGMAENPPFVTRAAADELGDDALRGCGVFVLTAAEVAELRLSDREQSLLRPYYALSSIGRFEVAPRPSHQVLYLTRNTAPTLAEFPRVSGHLQRFRFVLERRREVRSGKIAWWHLHWPREERLFTAPRVLCIQMGHVPRFAYAERPTFVGFSLHVIVRRSSSLPNSLTSLAALTAFLNSTQARHWFATHAKRRGAHLDISGTVIKQFPLPSRISSDLELELDRLVRTWPASDCDSLAAETLLDKLVEQIYVG